MFTQILFFKVLIDNHEAYEDQDDGGLVIKKQGGTSWNFHPHIVIALDDIIPINTSTIAPVFYAFYTETCQ